ncbi:hypothetical protein N2152v2_001536 [Parachlorella kessleri]
MPNKRWEHKIFGDFCVPGGFVKLSKTAVAIVDTPAFQRLRYLKQLGVCELVYPGKFISVTVGATHNRFAHSLGVAHRAREMLAVLQRRQPELGITDDDLQVVEIAGLCHDLGHGPFSHSFESELLPKILPDITWHHEEMSCTMLDYICSEYETGLSSEQQQRIKDLIASGRRAPQADWSGKGFMFDIVANKRNGLDVDKFDYLKRDNMACGELTSSDFQALIESMRVIDGQICFKASRRSVVQDVYSARARLHEEVYFHPVAKAADLMVVNALALAAEELGIAEAVQDPQRFVLLDDSILRELERSKSQSANMQRAQHLLQKLRHRDIYKPCGSIQIPSEQVETAPELTAEELLQYQDESCGVTLVPSDIYVHNLRIDYTMKNKNPLTKVGFYENDDDELFFNLTDNPFAPGTYMTRQVRVFLLRLVEGPSGEKQQYMDALSNTFKAWSNELPVAECEAQGQRARSLSHKRGFRAIVEAAKRSQQGWLMAQLAARAGHTPGGKGHGHGSLALAVAVYNRLAERPDLAPREQQLAAPQPDQPVAMEATPSSSQWAGTPASQGRRKRPKGSQAGFHDNFGAGFQPGAGHSTPRPQQRRAHGSAASGAPVAAAGEGPEDSELDLSEQVRPPRQPVIHRYCQGQRAVPVPFPRRLTSPGRQLRHEPPLLGSLGGFHYGAEATYSAAIKAHTTRWLSPKKAATTVSARLRRPLPPAAASSQLGSGQGRGSGRELGHATRSSASTGDGGSGPAFADARATTGTACGEGGSARHPTRTSAHGGDQQGSDAEAAAAGALATGVAGEGAGAREAPGGGSREARGGGCREAPGGGSREAHGGGCREAPGGGSATGGQADPRGALGSPIDNEGVPNAGRQPQPPTQQQQERPCPQAMRPGRRKERDAEGSQSEAQPVEPPAKRRLLGNGLGQGT